MSHLYNCVLGSNDQHIPLSEAEKKIDYKCLECKSIVRVKHGDIKRKHFYHLNLSNCNYYSPESIQHRECKSIIKNGFDNGDILFSYYCGCKYDTENYKSVIEYGFKYNESQKYADVAILDKNDNLFYIIEVYHTHKTETKNRPPNKWIEYKCEYIYDHKKINITLNHSCGGCNLITNNKIKADIYSINDKEFMENYWKNYNIRREAEWKRRYEETDKNDSDRRLKITYNIKKYNTTNIATENIATENIATENVIEVRKYLGYK